MSSMEKARRSLKIEDLRLLAQSIREEAKKEENREFIHIPIDRKFLGLREVERQKLREIYDKKKHQVIQK